jgi:hypothetical protein
MASIADKFKGRVAQGAQNAGLAGAGALLPGAGALLSTILRAKPSIDAFVGKVTGPAPANLFHVFISPPASVIKQFRTLGYDFELINLLCKSFPTPNLTIATTGLSAANNNWNCATGIDIDSLKGSWMIDQNQVVTIFFELWMNSIVDQMDSWAVHYRDDYVGDISLVVYDRAMDSQLEYKFHNAFPINKDSTELSFDNDNSIAELGVNFSYDYYTVSPMTIEQSIRMILRSNKALAAGITGFDLLSDAAGGGPAAALAGGVSAAKDFATSLF